MNSAGQNEITMYNYILEEKKILLDILNSRTDIAKELAGPFMSGSIDEIIISGSGTSLYAALATQSFLEKVLKVRVRVEYPMLFRDSGNIWNPGSTAFIGISQTGQSRSTIEALKKAKALGALTMAISEDMNSKICAEADVNIPMRCGKELCVAKTKGYIASLGILTVIGLEAARARGTVTEKQYLNYAAQIELTANNLDKIVSGAAGWVNSIKEELTGCRRMIVLGYKNNYGNVLEGALKMLETMRYGVCGYELEEFCHGIYNSINKDTYIIYLASEGDDKEKVVRLKSILGEITDHQFIIAKNIDGYEPTKKDCMLPFIEDSDFFIFEYIIPIQVIASIIPYELGINPVVASDPKFHSKIGSKSL